MKTKKYLYPRTTGFISIRKLERFEGMNGSQVLDTAYKVHNNHDSEEKTQNKRIALSNCGAQGDG